MNQDNRVLCRSLARELSAEEVNQVSGSLKTLTACTVDLLNGFQDGDFGIAGDC
ncbi:MAG TPA: hypothetical protein VLT16_11100 [Candidatus Limnocylindrales bacterium]|nr:hypothetical protein [Candidatus Limnocylindrales bacterium]